MSYEQFLIVHVGLGLDFVFVCLFRFTIFAFLYQIRSFESCVNCLLLLC